MKIPRVDFTPIIEKLEGTPWYVSDEKDSFGTSIIILSKKSNQYLSVAYHRGWTTMHGIKDEFPSIDPKHYGKYKWQSKEDFDEFDGPEDIIAWMHKHMDKDTTFPDVCWV